MTKNPFFILGCVRSGTTLLRDVLRRHPNLASPEETHFYRWGDPFGTAMAIAPLLNNPDLRRHRELDGISHEEFEVLLAGTSSKADLCAKYMNLYLSKSGQQGKRWFDKTPQNVNGSALIASQFPNARFVHIVRDPVDVVSSLRVGKVMKIESLVGACNYWLESVQILDVLKNAYPRRVYEVRYEDLTADFLPGLEKIVNFIGEGWDPTYFADVTIKASSHKHGSLFGDEELKQVELLCGEWGQRYGYFSTPHYQ